MAERKTGRQVVVILSFDKMPEGGTVNASKDEILQLLNKTQPSQIEDAGFAYEKAASAVESSMKTLEEHAGKILQVWKGADATKAKHAIQMMHATGGELATKLEMMGSALRQYAGYIPETISKVEGIKATEENGGGGTYGDAETKTAAEAAAKKAAEDREAQQAMRDLNKKIVDLYTLQVPHDVSYELPAVAVPGGTGSYATPKYPTSVGGIDGGGNGGSGGGSGYDGTGGSTGTGGTGHTGGSGGTGGTGHTGGSGGHGGSTGDHGGTGGTGGTGHTGGSDGTGGTGGKDGSDGGTGTGTGDGSTDGQNPGGPNGQTPGGPDGQTPGTHDPGSTSGSRDGTTPPVLGRDDTPSRQTQMESYQPTNTLTTPTTTGWSPTTTTYSNPFTTPTTTVGPLNTVTPTGGTPYVPSVLGNPHGGAGSVAGEVLPAGSLRGSATSGSTGMPVAPLLGGGAGGQDGEELPRNYYLAQDWDVAGVHGLPGGVLGGQEQV
ncbi:WXG100 family type VII secretion target [Nonomuraea sp. SMC257]|uniref:WXG100 family type VII secretion target n=1 Tax=Nonomuraea montanisoli TaxID=2741721 RepID=A0A7Y6I2C2_9ACTN|nr:WXG100 family type VII secretion target [Nonomuraea montanisoli]NUW30221.1 WXG100 family type VII secretion target [Nonomuraea montanisoli]